MSPASARKALGRYIGRMAARLASHVYLRPGAPAAMRVQGDSVVLPGAILSPSATAALAFACMPESGVRALEQSGSASFVVRAVELRLRYEFCVRQGSAGLEVDILSADIPPEPPVHGHAPFDPRRTPPTLMAEAVPE
jgi:Tfp pilus assembly ATPase PilU